MISRYCSLLLRCSLSDSLNVGSCSWEDVRQLGRVGVLGSGEAETYASPSEGQRLTLFDVL